MGATFGSGASPSNFEPYTRARINLANLLSSRRDLLEKHREIIDNVKFSEHPNKDTVFIQAKVDKFNKGIQDVDITEYYMFVDDCLFSNTFKNIKHAMVASIEALYIVLGYPNIEISQNQLKLDKYHQSNYSYKIIRSGKVLNSIFLGVGITEEKILKMVTALSNWPHNKKSFYIIQWCNTLW